MQVGRIRSIRFPAANRDNNEMGGLSIRFRIVDGEVVESAAWSLQTAWTTRKSCDVEDIAADPPSLDARRRPLQQMRRVDLWSVEYRQLPPRFERAAVGPVLSTGTRPARCVLA